MTIVKNSGVRFMKFADIPCGGTFKCQGKIYMKITSVINNNTEFVNAVNLENGKDFRWFYFDNVVACVKAKIIV